MTEEPLLKPEEVASVLSGGEGEDPEGQAGENIFRTSLQVPQWEHP